jgi:glycerol-3-phosphate acyltransferase PlsY
VFYVCVDLEIEGDFRALLMFIKVFFGIIAYLCGSIPFAYIIERAVKKADLRSVGSKNIGATNVFRTAGVGAGIITAIADILKGLIPVYFATFIDNSIFYLIVVGSCAILGHMFTIFLNFEGGKGVATGLGVFFVLMPLPSLVALCVFSLIFVFSGYASLGSVISFASFPITSYFLGYDSGAVFFAFLTAILIIYKHRENLKKLKAGREYKFKIFKKK